MNLPRHILESPQRLSESLLWKLQEEAYCQLGIEAWNSFGVPSYVTSNTHTAKSYAYVVLGYLRDCVANSTIDLQHPVYLLDLGAGTGRFAYFFLKELQHFLDSSSLPKIKICYVMTDIASGNIDFWQKHAYLKPYFDLGILDCAYYHHAQKEPIQLLKSKVALTKETLVNPLVLICNYFFDTIPQDLFRYKNGRLEEGRISLSAEGGETAALDPSVINRLHYDYSFFPIANPEAYYDSPYLDGLLEAYSRRLEGYTFLFPLGAFHVLQKMREWSQSRLFLLAGDQGVCTLDQLRQAGDPRLALHGSFSIAVNYHLIATFFRGMDGGSALLTLLSDPSFAVMAGILAGNQQYFPETALAFHEHIESFEPSDYLKFVTLTDQMWKNCPLDQILLLIKLGNWDANVVLAFFPAIRLAIPTADARQKETLMATIEHVWEHFYPIGPATGDFVLDLGVLLFEMGEYAKALVYFERSREISGTNELVQKNIAACRKMLGL